MKHRFLLFFLISIFFYGCQFGGSETTKTGNLHVIDISKKHPQKNVLLQSIADIEYIPLETTDDILLSGVCQLAYFSDKYVVIWEPRLCDIFIFDRNGRIITHFNHKGPGNEEYLMMKNVIFDEENEEIFVFDNPQIYRILVYSIAGEYKRTIKYSNDYLRLTAYNFDGDAFLVYDESGVQGSYGEKPYMLMSKNDGSIVSTLDISLPVRYSNRIVDEVEVNGQTFITPFTIFTPNNRYYGNNLLIADLSSDTVYLFTKNKELKPLIVRIPTVHSSEPRTVLTHQFATDKFIYLYKIPLDFEAAKKNNQNITITELMYEFTTGETSEISLVNEDHPSRAWWDYPFMYADLPQNMSAMLIQMSRLKEAYEEKQLKGKLEKLVKTLDVEDNPILMIVKFK
ncbi:MAG: 6-bladed beta-propeller [Tannerella sp.]|jgi:hypothetical protein|nr:6-bladed beta-propeller [Tannerella sp.]